MAGVRGALAVLLFASLLVVPPDAAAAASPRPGSGPGRAAAAGLPNDRLHFGLMNDPGHLSWMTSSGVPWRYRYQYLAGGVNTGNGWETWNSPPGQFAASYLADSATSHYIPVFIYYELLQSNPSVGSDENSRDFSNLNNTSTMNAYYANFTLLMKQARQFGGLAAVDIEPDLWGYLEQQAGNGSPASLTASVASSGDPDLAGLPNNVQGFAWALLKLRDLYAPNVLMGVNLSLWATGIDFQTNTDTTVDPVHQGDVAAGFLNQAGVASNPYGSTFDLVFSDVADHDAGSYGDLSHWWDRYNQRLPDFSEWLSYLGRVHADTGRPLLLWQVPVGNQYYLTMDDTCGHYQDNRAEYILGHVSQLTAAGIIGVLFGPGNSCQTNYTDDRGDGVTNGGGQPTSGYECNACNTHVSQWADDDGGYLRTFVGQYYRSTGCGTAALAVQGQTTVGGVLTAAPAAASWSPGRLDGFGRGSDGALWHAFSNGSGWSGWESLGGVLKGAPAAVSWGPDRIDVFVRGTDDELWHRWWDGSIWSGWEPLGGVLSSAPAVASWSAGRLDVVVEGSDGGLWHKWWDGGSWNGWESRGGAGLVASDPTAVSWASNRVDVFCSGTDKTLEHMWWDGSRWNGFESLGGSLTSAPAAASCAVGSLDVLALGAGSALWHDSFSGAWNGWNSLGGQWSQAPAAVADGAQVHVLSVSGTGALVDIATG